MVKFSTIYILPQQPLLFLPIQKEKVLQDFRITMERIFLGQYLLYTLISHNFNYFLMLCKAIYVL